MGFVFANLPEVLVKYRSSNSLVITVGKGGIGKTTIAVTTARGLATKVLLFRSF